MPSLKALGLFFGAALLFCGSVLATNHYPPEAKSTRTVVVVRVQWGTHAEVHKRCLANLPEPPEGQMILGCYIPAQHLIHAVEPTSFNDTYHLEVLGHEFWHALGASHP